MEKQAPGRVRDMIVEFMAAQSGDVSLSELRCAIEARAGSIPPSSIRSYLSLNTPAVFQRTERGRYRLSGVVETGPASFLPPYPTDTLGRAQLVEADAFEWMAGAPARSVEAIVTDPPYGLVEYTEREQQKLRNGRGGVWRIPPSFDGHQRSPLPRFTVLGAKERSALRDFFFRFGALCLRVTVPGANVIVASNPLLVSIVATAMAEAGLELRGTLVRLIMTMRGGDRPKNAHQEFSGVSVMPRSMWEPWVVFRHPLDGRVQDNLRRWGTGGFMRPSASKPFGDVIRSAPAPRTERRIAPHPSLKPQVFMRHLVRAVLPLGRGTVLDPFAGSGATLAAAEAVGYESIGIELDRDYASMARRAVPLLAALTVKQVDPVLA